MRLLLCSLTLALPLASQSTPFLQVLPQAAATADQPGATDVPFGAGSGRFQVAYDGSTAAYQAPMRITAVEFRTDRLANAAQAGTYTMTVAASTSRNPATALALTFAANHGPDRTVVYSGGFATGAPTIGQNPNPFGLRVPFFPPFEWDPRHGPLLLDIEIQSTATAALVWDAATSAVGTIVGNFGAATGRLREGRAPVLRLEAQARCAPTNLASVEGNGTTTLWAGALGYRRQDLYEASALGLTGPHVVTGLAWRTEGGAGMAGGTFSVTVMLATATGSAAAMGTTFEANLGADRTIVYQGTFTATPSPANPDPTKFDVFLPLQRPFRYDPAAGPLLVDVRRALIAPISPVVSFDAQTGATEVRSLLNVLSASSPTGTFSANVPVLGLRTVPVVTAPTTLAATTNTGTSLAPFSLPASRALHVIPAAASGVFQPTFLRHLRFRPAAGLDEVGPTTVRCTIDLSHAARAPGALSSTFDQNHGTDRVRVFDGEFSVPYTPRNPGDRGFPIEVCLTQPFRWDPAISSHLAIDIRMLGITGTGFAIETTAGLAVDDGRITSNTGAATGTIGDAAFVVQIGGTTRNGLATPYGSGCPGANGSPRCVTPNLPMLPDHEFRIGVLATPPGAAAVLALGFSPAATPIPGAPGCVALHSLDLGTVGLVIADAAGTGSLPIALRNLPEYHDLTFRAQWLVLDPSANPLGATTSDALQLTARFF